MPGVIARCRGSGVFVNRVGVPDCPDARNLRHAVDSTTRRLCEMLAAIHRSAARMNRWITLSGSLLLMLLARAGVASSLMERHWGVREGLPVQSVSQVLQTREGVLWLATFDGLVRFDGQQFRSHQVGNTEGMLHNRLTRIEALPDGQLLLDSEVGVLQRFDPEQGLAEGVWTHARGREALSWRSPAGALYISTAPGLGRLVEGRIEAVGPPELAGLTVTALGFGRSGALQLASAESGVWTLADGQLQALVAPEDLQLGWVHALHEGPRGQLWIAGEGGIRVVDENGLRWLQDQGRPWRTSTQTLQAGGVDVMLSGGEQGLHAWRAGRAEAIDPADPRRSPRQLRVAQGGGHWLVSASAVFRELAPGVPAPAPIFRLPDPEDTRITQVMVDQADSLWIATLGAGLYRLTPVPFSVISEAEGLSAREVYPLHEGPDGAVWVGTQRGSLNRIDADGRVRSYGADTGLQDDHITAIAHDVEGRLWVATHEAGLHRGDPAGRFRREADPALATARIRALFLDRSGRFWAGGDAALYRREGAGPWQRDPVSAALAGCTVRVIREADDALWFGTHRCGAFRLGRDGLERYGADGDQGSDFIRDLRVVDAATVWLASEDRGLIRLRRGAGGSTSVSIRARHGLPGDGAHRILADGHGWLWVSTNQGIVRTREAALEALADALMRGESPPTLALDHYAEADGLRSREANGGVQDSAIRTADGRLWFATQDGVAIVDPDPASLRTEFRPVIEAVHSGDLRWSARAPLTLAARQRSIRIDYGEQLQLDPARTRLRYQLIGHDEDWIEAGTLRRASYPRVPPGDYRFEVQAWSAAGWVTPGATLRLRIEPYWHETPGFRIALLLLVLLLLYLGYRGRVAWLEAQRQILTREVALRTGQLAEGKAAAERAAVLIAEQAAQLREVDRQKSRFFDDLAHELRTPLTLILGPLQDVRQGGGPAEPAIDAAIRNGEVLLDLTHQLLDLARLEAGQLRLDLRVEDLGGLLRRSACRFAPMAQARGIGFRSRLPAEALPVRMDPRHAGKIVDNLLSNAFKFTGAGGQVELRLQVDAGQALVEVADTGVGIEPEHLDRVFDRYYQTGPGSRLAAGTGIGLALVRELTDLHRGQLEVQSRPGVGTVFRVRLPLAVAVDGVPAECREWTPPIAPADSPRIAADEDTEDAEATDRTTVLVVDDHAELRARIAGLLAPRYRVIEAADGEAALRLARTRLPDLVVADVSMPVLDGYGLCAAIRQDPELEGVPIILLTARAGLEHRLEGLRAAADDYLTKPFETAELLVRVDNLIRLRQRLRARQTADSAAANPPEPDAGRVGAPSGGGPASAASPADESERYRERLYAILHARLSDETFKVADLATAMNQDRSHLFRRVRELTGQAPSDLLRDLRLDRAAELLRQHAGAVGEIAYAVGFNSVAHFTKAFRERHGRTPGQYRSACSAGAAKPGPTPAEGAAAAAAEARDV